MKKVFSLLLIVSLLFIPLVFSASDDEVLQTCIVDLEERYPGIGTKRAQEQCIDLGKYTKELLRPLDAQAEFTQTQDVTNSCNSNSDCLSSEFCAQNNVCETPVAPVLSFVEIDNGAYMFTWSQPTNSEYPSGGYDFWIDGVDQSDNGGVIDFEREISGLDISEEHCFFIEGRWYQMDEPTFPRSETICVNASSEYDFGISGFYVGSTSGSNVYTLLEDGAIINVDDYGSGTSIVAMPFGDVESVLYFVDGDYEVTEKFPPYSLRQSFGSWADPGVYTITARPFSGESSYYSAQGSGDLGEELSITVTITNDDLELDSFCSNGVQDNGESGVDCGGECATQCGETNDFGISGFYVGNVNDGTQYQTLSYGSVINVEDYPSGTSIVAQPYGDVESVVYFINDVYETTEQIYPFTLRQNFNTWAEPGTYIIKAIPYNGETPNGIAAGVGDQGEIQTITITINESIENYECISSSDCNPNYFCNQNNECEQLVECYNDNNCLSGEVCTNNECIPEEIDECTPSTEVCDGVDNDCDSVVDENNVCQDDGSVDPNPIAPVLESVILVNNNYELIWSQPSTELPGGGYDTVVNGVDYNDRSSVVGFERIISGLDVGAENCFRIEGRWIQLSTSAFPRSNEICVAGVVQEPECTTNTQCQDGYYCSNEVCLEDVECYVDNNCLSSEYCSNSNECVSIPGFCMTDDDCSSNYVCSSDVCVYDNSNSDDDPVDVSDPVVDDDVSSELKAFPSAYGAGAYATGGRGGEVVKVTNLNDNGPGSFRAALGNQGPTIIVFDVSGTIELESQISTARGDLTIAGQTAPEGGITITGAPVVFRRWTDSSGTLHKPDNIIMRHIRFRPNYPAGTDAVSFIGGSDVIVDHVSASWGGDEIFSFRDVTERVTLQNMLFAEGKTGTILGDSNDPSKSKDISLHNTLFYDITHRFPNANAFGRFDVLNNVVYNWKYRLANARGNLELNHMNNYYVPGCLDDISGHKNKGQWHPTYVPSIFTSGNIVQDLFTDPDADNWELWEHWYDPGEGPYNGVAESDILTTDYRANQMFTPLLGAPKPLLTAQEAYEKVTAESGASKRLDDNGNVIVEHDFLDEMFLAQVRSGGCSPYTSYSSYQDYPESSHYIDFHNSVSSTPLATHPSGRDADNDGMPDVWEVANGFNPNVDDSAGDLDGDGYTNIEEFINLVDGAVLGNTDSSNNDTDVSDDSVCGDSVVSVGEQCDDGNSFGGDGCSSSCLIEVVDVECVVDSQCPGDLVCNELSLCVEDVVSDTSFGVDGFFVSDTTQVDNLRTLQDGDVIDVADFPSIASVAASVFGGVESVIFFVNGVHQNTENIAPFTVEQRFDSWALPGVYTITAVPYSDDSDYNSGFGNGEEGVSMSITLTVAGGIRRNN